MTRINENFSYEECFKIIENIKMEIIPVRRKILSLLDNEIIFLYYLIGEELNKNSKYGSGFIDKLSDILKKEFPYAKGLSSRNLRYMKKFAKEFKYDEILKNNLVNLPWRVVIMLLDKLDNHEEMLWYAQMASQNAWSRKILEHKIHENLYTKNLLKGKIAMRRYDSYHMQIGGKKRPRKDHIQEIYER